MQTVKGFDCYHSDDYSAVTFGKFDGLHMGHKKLIDTVHELGKLHNLESIVCAFDMRKEEQIMTTEEKELILDTHVDVFIDCLFTKKIRTMTPELFVDRVIDRTLHAKYVVVGENFRFGYKARGDIHELERLSKKYGYELIVIRKETYDSQAISSTIVREALKSGDLYVANHLLGYEYGILGKVTHGRKLGRQLGFPTINIDWPAKKMTPALGVYLSHVYINGKKYNAISNIGIQPTVTKDEHTVAESFLLDFDEEVYDETVRVEFLEFVRSERKFEDVAALQRAVERDIAYAKKYFEKRK